MTTWNQGGTNPTSAWSECAPAPDSVWQACDGPPPPAHTVATPVYYTSVDVTWDAAPGADAYDVERDGMVIASGIAVLIYHDTGLTPNTTYAYRVRASTGGVLSSFGNTATATPTWRNIPDRYLWLDATADADLLMATGVRGWTDHSGNGLSVSQGVAGQQPAKVPAALNGLQVVRFDGVDDMMTLTPVAAEFSGGATFFVVANVKWLVNDTKAHPLINLTPMGVQHEPSNDGNAPSRSKLETFAFTNAGLKRATPAAVTVPGARLVTSRVSPTDPALTLWKNGVVDAGPTIGFASLTSSIGATLLLVHDGQVSYGQYDLGEVVVFRRALTSPEQVAVEAALLAKWGL